ncbi:tetratricopeptide repeat protein [Limisphaera sp. 4302-co]|uniref:tetratricopeptide repeat protein n=1 Tax=Limisphaera sp. 4302-co TaxID=3400417 RepID=UPI003C14661F
MTTQPLAMQQERRFVSVTLPWAVAGTAWVLYLLTLNRGLTVGNILSVAGLTGLQWQPGLASPVYTLLTWPLRGLPAGVVPVVLSAFSALCAAGVLGLLARCVALLPYDRTPLEQVVQRNEWGWLTGRRAWIPVVAACVVGGLHFPFWDRARDGGPAMFDLLLFAWVVRCLLEYRVDAREGWLDQAVFVYALGMVENWVQVLLLPAFVGALMWVMGWSFFRARFLTRAWLLGLAGCAFYLATPLLARLHPEMTVPFWPAVKMVLAEQKNQVVAHVLYAREALVLAALFSLIPLAILAVRFRPLSGDISRVGSNLTNFSFHVLRGIFLVGGLWVALEPPFAASRLGLSTAFLPLHWLGALVVGYSTGYFLVVFGERRRSHRWNPGLQRRNRAVVAGVYVLLVASGALLFYRNFPVIRTADGRWLTQYGRLAREGLPAQAAVLLSDDPLRLWPVLSVLQSTPDTPPHLGVDTRLLSFPEYHQALRRWSDGVWPEPPTNTPPGPLNPVWLVDRLLRVAQVRPVYYLHPSFGYYFENFRPLPHGLVWEMQPYDAETVLPPPLDTNAVAENLRFWRETAGGAMDGLRRALGRSGATNLLDRLLSRLRVGRPVLTDARLVALSYARALTWFGVDLQRAGRWEEAADCFRLALELNPDNVVARINAEYNRTVREGNPTRITLSGPVEDLFRRYRTWDQLIGDNGPFDEPTFCYEQGRVFAQGFLFRQAIREFDRVRQLDPQDLPSRLWLAQLYLTVQRPRHALAVVEELKVAPERFGLTFTNQIELLGLEGMARMQLGQPEQVHKLLQQAVGTGPTNHYLLAVCAQVYLRAGDWTNAIPLFDRQLEVMPQDTDAMMNKGYACLQAGRFEEAVEVLNRLLTLQPNNHPAWLNRAIAQLRLGRLDDAWQDYQRLLKLYPRVHTIHYGLAEIAWRRRDTNTAIQHYEAYLETAPRQTAEYTNVMERLRSLRGGGS